MSSSALQNQGPNSQHLDQIISCVQQIPYDLRSHKPEPPKLQSLYSQADHLIKNFESTINRCKRYNEAKINRKYEMIIQQLQNEVKKLNQKLKIQQDARSPTKKHVCDILDQLVIYKEENQGLKKEVQALNGKVKELEEKCENFAAGIKKMQNVQPKAMIQRLPALNVSSSISDSIKQYLKDKQNVRRVVQNSQKSNLQKFLHQSIPKAWNWTLGNLLQQLDKWSQGIKPTKQVDMWRIRSSVARSFSQYLDDSQSLTRPASFTKNILSPLSHSTSNNTHQNPHMGMGMGRMDKKKDSRFSMFGDKERRVGNSRSVLDSSVG